MCASARPLRRTTSRLAVAAALSLLVARGASAVEGAGPVDVATEAVFTRESPIGAITYTPGRGLALGDTGLRLGGYANATVVREEGDPAVFSLQDLSMFVFWRLAPRLDVFAELEVENSFQIDDEGDAGSPNERFTAERLYADYLVADALTVRGGTFLVPVGRWNLLHAAPLVWTTSRPLVTEEPFDPRTTGVMVYGSFFPGTTVVRYSLYGQLADPLEGNPGFTPDDHSAGARVEVAPVPTLSLGASVRSAERRGDWRHLGGLDFLWLRGPLELQSEAAVSDGDPGSTEWGVYLQAAIEILPRFHLVERFEHFDPARGRPVNLVASGVAFQVLPNAVVKAEYLAADTRTRNAAPGFRAEAAILF